MRLLVSGRMLAGHRSVLPGPCRGLAARASGLAFGVAFPEF